jgi:hypothetical protein
MTTDADLMLALYNRLSQLTSAVVLMGEPSAVQSAPLVYLMGYQTDYRSSGGHEIIDMRPRIRLVVRWQDAPNAEAELLGLQAVVHDLVTATPLLDGACKVRWEQTLYGYLSVAGTRYRMAQLAPVLTTM